MRSIHLRNFIISKKSQYEGWTYRYCVFKYIKLMKSKNLTASKPFALKSFYATFLFSISQKLKKIITISWWWGENDRMTYIAMFIVESDFGVCLWNFKDEWFFIQNYLCYPRFWARFWVSLWQMLTNYMKTWFSLTTEGLSFTNIRS